METNETAGELEDPVLGMIGIGWEIWQCEPADGFVARLRSEDPIADLKNIHA